MKLTRAAYAQLIDEDISALNRVMPVESLERKHIEDVLRWSITENYDTVRSELPTVGSTACRLTSALQEIDRYISEFRPDSRSMAMRRCWRWATDALASTEPCQHQAEVTRLRLLCDEAGKWIAERAAASTGLEHWVVEAENLAETLLTASKGEAA